MELFRWSGLIAFVVIVGLITIFCLFFLDGIIKGIIEDRASSLVGAKVEIGDLRTKILGAECRHPEVQWRTPKNPCAMPLK